jgi:hypothetical protein
MELEIHYFTKFEKLTGLSDQFKKGQEKKFATCWTTFFYIL